MSTVRVGSICFRLYPDDHAPMHVHAEFAELEVIIELKADGTVALADRSDQIQPKDAKRSDVKGVLSAAQDHFDELALVWEKMHP